MKLMLTSFGIDERSAPTRGQSLFHRMPPVSFRLINEAFMPDYELLVLCDQVVMDESSFQQLIDSPARAYSGVADTFRALKAEGRIELVDFSSVLRANPIHLALAGSGELHGDAVRRTHADFCRRRSPRRSLHSRFSFWRSWSRCADRRSVSCVSKVGA